MARRIEAIWSFSACTPGSAVILPDGRCDIIVRNHVSTPDEVTPIITGPATLPYRVDYKNGDQWFGIRLRPEHGAALWQDCLGNAPDSVLRGSKALDRFPTLAVLRGSGPTLDDLARIVHAQTWPEVDPRLTRAIDILHASGGRLRIEALARFVGCTARHLNRLFRRNVGLSAKTYAQLIQFHRTLKLITNGNVPIIAAAFEGGFSDQAHMARTFRRFGGFTPSRIPTDLSLPDIPSK
ncbi:helix-turn-helix transcriptional regulator [Hyphomonas atlantica]|uniref:helix-turn-helix transcriptional regulator n=1 Tax=Hyphomonas atlantica TaxID=1280948 RepID=UPI003517684E